MAWDQLGNYENFEVFSSWGSDQERANRHVDDFEFVDHEGVKTEVHIKKVDQKGCFKDFFWG